MGTPCAKCGGPKIRTPGGRWRCRPCYNAKAREYTAAYPERRQAYHRKYYQANKAQYRRNAKAWQAANKERHQRWHRENKLLERYGLTLNDYERMSASQDGRCAICGEHSRLVVDHDHKTGAVRGLLCEPCNFAIGRMKDDPRRMESAARYLRAVTSRQVG